MVGVVFGGFCRLFREVFTDYATPVLDFYHAAQNVWKVIKPELDGRTKNARNYFRKAQRLLKTGQTDSILADIDAALELDDLPPNVRKKLKKLYAYLSTHKKNIEYARFKELGLPIGSEIVEKNLQMVNSTKI